MVLFPESQIRVLADLDLRDNPQDAIRGTAVTGSELTVTGGPRDFEDGTWYEVRDPDGLPAWVRIADAAAVEVVAGDCPDDDQDAMTMLAWDRLECLGDESITVDGQLGHCQGGVVEAEPEWLAFTCWVISDLAGGSMGIHVAPGSGVVLPEDIPAESTVEARVTGHLDDPEAATCLFHADNYADTPWLAPGAEEQILLCREAFVVDALEILN